MCDLRHDTLAQSQNFGLLPLLPLCQHPISFHIDKTAQSEPLAMNSTASAHKFDAHL